MSNLFFKRVFLSLVCLSVIVSFVGCFSSPASTKGDFVLIAHFVNDKTSVSETALIKNALVSGGEININVELARELDPEFDSKFTNTGSDGQFLVRPSLLNFIGGNGWNFKQSFCINLNSANMEYYFTKPRM